MFVFVLRSVFCKKNIFLMTLCQFGFLNEVYFSAVEYDGYKCLDMTECNGHIISHARHFIYNLQTLFGYSRQALITKNIPKFTELDRANENLYIIE